MMGDAVREALDPSTQVSETKDSPALSDKEMEEIVRQAY